MAKKLKKEFTDAELIAKVNSTIDSYNEGYLTIGDFGYKYYPKKMTDIVYLYAHNVDTSNPDLLGITNKNTQRNPIQSIERKWQEQTNIDLKDINFLLSGATPMGRFVPKAANRKIMKDNNFDEVIDQVNINSIRYGSGYLKQWRNEDKELKMKQIEPYAMVFDIYNFKKGLKIERIKKTPREISSEETYEQEPANLLLGQISKEKLDDEILLFQVVQDYPDGTQSIYIVSTEYELVFYKYTTKKSEDKIISYKKNNFINREGFEDAPGIGLYELVFNELVQSKVNYERMDRVMEIATKIMYQKKIDGTVDNVAGKNVIKFKDGAVLGYAENKLEPLNAGGMNQITALRNELNELTSSFPNSLNMSDALLGKVLPAGSSGEYASILAENSSSVLKEYQKKYTNFIDRVYTDEDGVIPYMLDVLNTDDDLQKYLTPNDYKLLKRGVKNYLLVQEQINAVLNNEEYDPAEANEKVEREMKKKKIVPGDLLEKLREEWEGLETFISYEKVSKGQILAFLNKVEQLYLSNPQALQDPFIRETLSKQAEYDAGMSVLEIEELFQSLPDQQPQENVQEESTV
jgi:hypothetical protein